MDDTERKKKALAIDRKLQTRSEGLSRCDIERGFFESHFLGITAGQQQQGGDNFLEPADSDYSKKTVVEALNQLTEGWLPSFLVWVRGEDHTFEAPRGCQTHRSKPVAVLVSSDDFPPSSKPKDGNLPWHAVKFLLELTSTSKNNDNAAEDKRTQWYRYAHCVFAGQPSRNFLLGLVQMQQYLCWCHADHGGVAFSEFFQPDDRFRAHLQEIIQSDRLGHSPSIAYSHGNNGRDILQRGISIQGKPYSEVEVLYYHPDLLGRNPRVTVVRNLEDERLAMKTAWEGLEIQPEAEIYDALKSSGVENMPEIYARAAGPITKDLPNGRPAFSERSRDWTKSSYNEATATSISPSRGETGVEEQTGNTQLFVGKNVQRRLQTIVMDKCERLPWVISQPRELVTRIRETMICYYDIYKTGGYLHADISPANIMLRNGAAILVDFNSSYRVKDLLHQSRRSGTLAYMAINLINERSKLITRTIGHDLESFFMVLLYFATKTGAASAFDTPLFKAMAEATKNDVLYGKACCLMTEERFKREAVSYFQEEYKRDEQLQTCMLSWRTRLFATGNWLNDAKFQQDEEKHIGAWKACMKHLDDYLADGDMGVQKLEEIDKKAAERKTRGIENMIPLS